MSPEFASVMMFVVLLIFLVIGMPLAFALGTVGCIFGYLSLGSCVFPMFASRVYSLMTNYIMTAVPVFVFMAYLLEISGAAERLYIGFRNLFGPLRGGLAIGTVAICTLFAASTGVIGAAVVTMSLLAVPSMLKYGYAQDLATGTTCAAGTLGILIPPSIMLVVYGSLSGISVGKLFMAAFLPGLLLSSLYILYIAIRCFIRPDDGPAMSYAEISETSLSQRLWKAMLGIAPMLLLIIAVLGTIFTGIATPTEAAAVGCFIAFLMVIGNGQFSLKSMSSIVIKTLKTTCMVNLIVIFAGCFTTVFLGIGGGETVTNFLLGLGLPDWGILFLMLFIVFILGMFIDWIGILLICTPLFLPIAKQIGYDPLWFALLICLTLQMAFITPPFAYAIFYLKGVAPKEVQLTNIYKGVLPFVALQWLAVLLCIIFPQIILWLPSLIKI